MLAIKPNALAFAAVCAAFAAMQACQAQGQAKLSPLQYRLKAGETYVYSVRVEVDGGDRSEAHSGAVAYKIKSTDGGLTLAVAGKTERTWRGKDADPPLPIAISFARTAPDAAAKIDQYGVVLRQTTDTALPFALGDLTMIALDPLSPDGAANWESTGSCAFVVTDAAGRTVIGPPQEGLDRARPVSLPAREKASYTLGERSGDLVTIQKTYEAATRETVGGAPRLKIAGTGTITFDARAGAPRSVEFKGTITRSEPKSATSAPITVSCRLLTGVERADALRILAQPYAEVERPVTNPQILALLSDLRSGNHTKLKPALDKLASVPPDDNRKPVARAIVEQLHDTDLFVRWAAVVALGNWATYDTIPRIIDMLHDPEHAVRWAAIEQLGKLADERACMPLAIMVDSGKDRDFAAGALEKMGPVSEEVAIKLLTSDEWTARNWACRILKKNGSAKAIPDLKLHARRDENGIVKMGAADAIKEIEARSH